MAKYFAALAVLLLILVGVIYLQTEDQIERPGDLEQTEIPRVPEESELTFSPSENGKSIRPGVPGSTQEPPGGERDADPLSLYDPETGEPGETEVPLPGEDAFEPPVAAPDTQDEADLPEVRVPEEPAPLEKPAPLDAREPFADSPEIPELTEDDQNNALPYPWTGRVQESQPGFVEPNRLDSRQPTGDPIISDPLPTGPEAGFYDRQEQKFPRDRRPDR